MTASLPATPFPCDEVRPAKADRTCHVRSGTNGCSVPPDHAGAKLTLTASRRTVRILDGASGIASHRRCYGRQQAVSDPGHVRAIMARKRRGRAMSVRDRLLRMVPRAEEMLALTGQERRNVATCARMLAGLLEIHGADAPGRAIAAALERGLSITHSYRPDVTFCRACLFCPS